MKKIVIRVVEILILVIVFYGYNHYEKMKNPKVEKEKEFREEIKVEEKKENFQIRYIDVGEADSILIQNNGKYALIDAGNNEDGEKLVKYFQSLGIQKLEYVIGTHAHEDHIGGMDDIIKNFQINHFYMPDVVTTTRTFEEILENLEKKSIRFETPKIGETFTLDETNFKIIWVGDNEEDLNSTSIILRAKYKNTTYLFTGDATIEVEKQILDEEIESDVLKVSHHGSKQSNSDAFLRKVNPKYAIISVGKENDYGFPKKVILNKLKSIGSKIYRTDELGTIIVSSDGNEIYVTSEYTDTNGEEK